MKYKNFPQRPKQVFVARCQHVYFCSKDGEFNMEVYGKCVIFGASLKWQFEDLHFSGTSVYAASLSLESC